VRRAKLVDQSDAMTFAEQMVGGPGAEHAGADDGDMSFGTHRRGFEDRGR
jgi:hypothetical protein